MIARRRFLACSAASLTASWLSTTAARAAAVEHPLIIFAKPLEHLPFEELGRRLSQVGVQGIEATLRPGGQISPDQFEQQLPQLVDALSKHDQRVVIAASNINHVDASSEKQLQQFARARIPYFRMDYYRYDFSQPLLPQLESFARQAAELAQLCQSLGIQAVYQNHAGKNYVGAALWDLQRVLSDVAPQWLSVAFDIRHAALELSQSWLGGYSVLRPHIGAIYVKDVSWQDNRPQNVPLGTGITRPVFEAVLRDGLVGPLSLHVEYIDHRPAELQEQRWEAVTRDVDTLRQWLGR